MISFKHHLREISRPGGLSGPDFDAPNIDVKALVWRSLQAATRPLENTPLAPMWSRVPMSQSPSNLQSVLRHYASNLPRRYSNPGFRKPGGSPRSAEGMQRPSYDTLRRTAVAFVLDVEFVDRKIQPGILPSFDRALIVEPVTKAILVIPSIRKPKNYHRFPQKEVANAVAHVMRPVNKATAGDPVSRQRGRSRPY